MSQFLEYILHDVLGHIPNITHRKLFGGFGIYHEGAIFAIIADDELYFKVGDNNRSDYEAADSRPFIYTKPKSGKEVTLNYWLVPEEVMDDEEMVEEWMEKAKEAHK